MRCLTILYAFWYYVQTVMFLLLSKISIYIYNFNSSTVVDSTQKKTDDEKKETENNMTRINMKSTNKMAHEHHNMYGL